MITSMSNRNVKQVALWQTKAKERKKDGVFLAEGLKMLKEAPIDWIREVYLSPEGQERAREDAQLWQKLQRVGYESVASEVFRKMSDTQTPQGALTVLRQPNHQLEDLLSENNPLLVLLEDLQDPGNLGTILRTGEGAGITGVIMSRGTVDIYNPKVIRATMGSIYRVPFVYVEELQQVLASLRERGIRSYAAHLQGQQYYSSFSFREGIAFLIGNEGNGLSKAVSDAADAYLKIPMEGSVESLNAGVAAALLMYEAHRQRHEGWTGKGK